MEVVFGGQEGDVRLDIAPSGKVDPVVIRFGPLEGAIQTTLGLDVPRLRDDLRAIVEGDTLSGSTSFESVEHDFRLRVSLEHGKGTIEGEVTTQVEPTGTLSFALTTDQSFLGATLAQLDGLLRDT